MTGMRRVLERVGAIVAATAVIVSVGALTTAPPAAPSAFPGANGRIAFYTNINGDVEIVTIDPDGSGLRNLTQSPGFDAGPAWSADGSRIAFTSDRAGSSNVFVMKADGSGQRQLTNGAAIDSGPSFSPNGKRIAFASNRDGDFEIFAMNADGTGVTQLTSNTFADASPTWSPDGEHIAFTGDRTGNLDIFVMNADGSSQHDITNDPGSDLQPTWSPDGEKIAFGRANDIWVMSADGSAQRALTTDAQLNQQPAWSPDGEQIAFVKHPGLFEVWRMDADGSNQRSVSGPAGGEGPSWQPRSVDGAVTITKTVVGTPPPGTTFTVKVDCAGEQDDKTLTFPETGGTQTIERDSFGPLECDVTEPAAGGASTTTYTCDAGRERQVPRQRPLLHPLRGPR